jgi:hypothetical protein
MTTAGWYKSMAYFKAINELPHKKVAISKHKLAGIETTQIKGAVNFNRVISTVR